MHILNNIVLCEYHQYLLVYIHIFKMDFNFSFVVYCTKNRIHFRHPIPISSLAYAQRLQGNLVLPKQNTITKVQNLPFGIISSVLSTLAEKIELMSIADSSRIVASEQLSDFMDILASWHKCFVVNKLSHYLIFFIVHILNS